MLFKDRADAGKQLAKLLGQYRDNRDVIVIGLPRGGVVVAKEVARELKAPLDIIVPRKIGAPSNPEFALGAITEDGEPVFQEGILETYGIQKEYLTLSILKEKNEALRRLKVYRGDREPLDLANKTAILVDDGIATGATMIAAVYSARKKGAAKVVVAVPVLAQDIVPMIEKVADELVFVEAMGYFGAVGRFYESFEQTEDGEVVEMLRG